MKSQKKGYLYACLAAFFFAFIAIIGKSILRDGVGPFQLLTMQYSFSILILFVFIFITNRTDLKTNWLEIRLFMLQGILGSAFTSLLFYMALQTINAGMASLLLFINPVYITLFFSISGIRKIKSHNWLALAFAVIGSILVLNLFQKGQNQIALQGLIFGGLSGLCYAFYNVFADLKLKNISPNKINMYSSLFGLVFTIMIALITGQSLEFASDHVFSIFSLSILSGILPILFIYKALQLIGSEKVSVIASLELPITLILAYLVLNEHMQWIQIIGVLMVIVATFILHLNEPHFLSEPIDADIKE